MMTKRGRRRFLIYAITGARGNADILLGNGEKVWVIGRSAARLQGHVARGAEAKVGDLTDSNFLARAFSGAKAVFTMIPPKYKAPDFRAYQKVMSDSLATG